MISSKKRCAELLNTFKGLFHNLVQVLWQQGRQKKALRAVQRSVALGGLQLEV